MKAKDQTEARPPETLSGCRRGWKSRWKRRGKRTKSGQKAGKTREREIYNNYATLGLKADDVEMRERERYLFVHSESER